MATELKWSIDNIGDHVAICENGTYRVTFENGNGYRIRFAGYPIGLAQTIGGAKDHALIHYHR